MDEWEDNEIATTGRREPIADVDLGEIKTILFERLVKTRSVSLLCQGNCHKQSHGQITARYTPHSYRRLIGKASELTKELISVAVVFACDECGHERKWGMMSGDPHKPDPA